MSLINLEGDREHSDLELWGPQVRLRIWFGLLSSEPIETEDSQRYLALVDTGARVSCIDTATANLLDLPAIGEPEEGIGVAGPSTSQPVLALIRVVGSNAVAVSRFMTLPLIENGLPHHTILGRDFLRLTRFTCDGIENAFELSVSAP